MYIFIGAVFFCRYKYKVLRTYCGIVKNKTNNTHSFFYMSSFVQKGFFLVIVSSYSHKQCKFVLYNILDISCLMELFAQVGHDNKYKYADSGTKPLIHTRNIFLVCAHSYVFCSVSLLLMHLIEIILLFDLHSWIDNESKEISCFFNYIYLCILIFAKHFLSR